MAFGAGVTYAMGTGTQLPETVEVIKRTIDWHFDKCKADLNKLALQSNSKVDNSDVRALADELNEAKKIKIALDRIHTVYSDRYKADPNNAGLLQLKDLVVTQNARVNSFEKHYTDLVAYIDQNTLTMASIDQNQALTESMLNPTMLTEITDDQAAKSLTAYCEKWCPGISAARSRNNDRPRKKYLQCFENEL